MYRGAFHLHSTHSYDGKVPLPLLCKELRGRGYQFALITEHDDTLDADSYGRIRLECQALSNDEFLAIPGIEVRCWRSEGEQWHIAALGVSDWISRGSIPQVVSAIRAAGGLAVLLHPHKYSSHIDAGELRGFDGVEVWNGKEDGRISPRAKTVRLARQAARVASVPMYAGLDLHDLGRVATLGLEVQAQRLEPGQILAELQRGSFHLDTGGARFPSLRGPSVTQRAWFAVLRGAYLAYGRMRRIPIVGQIFARLAARQR